MASNSTATGDPLDTTCIKIEPDVKYLQEMVIVTSGANDELYAAEQPTENRAPVPDSGQVFYTHTHTRSLLNPWTAMETAGSAGSEGDKQMPEKDFILKFESLPELWDTANPHYNIKFKRYQNLSKLLPILRRIKPNADIQDVKNKINTLRSNYRRELRKVAISRESGSVDIYTPKLWYYPHLEFLQRLEQPKMRDKKSQITDQQEKFAQETSTSEEMTEAAHVTESSTEIQTSFTSLSSPIKPEPSSKKKKMNHDHHKISKPTYINLTETTNISNSVALENNPRALKNNPIALNHKPIALENNPIALENYPIALKNNPIALEWASILDRLDPIQRLHAKKAINDILYEAELGNLNRYSVKINENSTTISGSISYANPPNNSPIYILQSPVTPLPTIPNNNNLENQDEAYNNSNLDDKL